MSRELFRQLTGAAGWHGERHSVSLVFPLEGTHHRGHDDAWNIAALLANMITENGQEILSDLWNM